MAERKPSKEAETVTVRNNVRRPISFTCGGKTYRLSPGEEVEVPAAFAQSIELSRLHAAGQVSKTAPAEAKGASKPSAARAEKRDEEDEAEDKPPRKPDRRRGA